MFKISGSFAPELRLVARILFSEAVVLLEEHFAVVLVAFWRAVASYVLLFKDFCLKYTQNIFRSRSTLPIILHMNAGFVFCLSLTHNWIPSSH